MAEATTLSELPRTLKWAALALLAIVLVHVYQVIRSLLWFLDLSRSISEVPSFWTPGLLFAILPLIAAIALLRARTRWSWIMAIAVSALYTVLGFFSFLVIIIDHPPLLGPITAVLIVLPATALGFLLASSSRRSFARKT